MQGTQGVWHWSFYALQEELCSPEKFKAIVPLILPKGGHPPVDGNHYHGSFSGSAGRVNLGNKGLFLWLFLLVFHSALL